MAVRSRQMVPSTASQVLVKIESRAQNRLAGRLYNPYLDAGAGFSDVMEFTNLLDEMFDSLSFPQATMEYRSFDARKAGKKATAGAQGPKVVQGVSDEEKVRPQDSDVFVVHVQFRQNATWQGTVRWSGQPEEKRFRSTLELLKIMDSALEQKGAGDEKDEG
ncbi:hypothetical protein LJC04_01950 [Ruminococcaceae bacterium OttesenSCG-928-O06]|nr:hypothetical protein [Ruminococcaceae bacterium OttesenSCG-928-O06]